MNVHWLFFLMNQAVIPGVHFQLPGDECSHKLSRYSRAYFEHIYKVFVIIRFCVEEHVLKRLSLQREFLCG
jgi:hypothetical protein